MPSKRRIRLSLKLDEALRANRVFAGKQKLVYILIADRRLKYPNGRARIAYIGTTRKGGRRTAQSVAAKADGILSLHGVRSFRARIVTCRPRQKVKTWHKLERALLIAFRERFGEVPKGNSHGKKMKATDEFEYFRKQGVNLVIDELALAHRPVQLPVAADRGSLRSPLRLNRALGGFRRQPRVAL